VKLREDDLEIEFTDAIGGFVFDQMNKKLPGYHGIGQMYRVDFIVEFTNDYLFVEVEDPENPKARKGNVKNFYTEIEEGELSSKFAAKFLDSFIYRWAEEKTDKKIHFINLVTIDTELLPNFSDEIAKKIPPFGKINPRWTRHLFYSCQVFNLKAWNDSFPKWPANRISEVKTQG